jgi:HTH-type transcriptional regulator, cell division transcriptional repressor
VNITHIQPGCPLQVKRVHAAHAVKKTTKLRGRNIIGKRVRDARLKAVPPVSQEDLAGRLAALDVTLDRSAISRIEAAERYVMDYEAAALARALKVPVEWLFGG